MTRGHNIVADGWPGKSKPPPTNSLTHAHTTAAQKMRFFFCIFNSTVMDHWTNGQWTNGRTNRWTDGWILKPIIELRVHN